MYLLFSHRLTDDQVESAKKDLGIKEFIYLPEEEQEEWSNVDPYLEVVNIPKINKYIDEIITDKDIALVQGDWGATLKTVLNLKEKGVKAVYSTNIRKVLVEKKISDKIVSKTSVFEHAIFRLY